MEYSKFATTMKFLAPNGVTICTEERLQLTMALGQLDCEMGFEELHLWGKIEGKFPLNLY